jgi:glycosidase
MPTKRVFGLQVSAPARHRYRFDNALFLPAGAVAFASMRAAREFATRVNQVRGASAGAVGALHAADLNAAGIIHEALFSLLDLYRRRLDPEVIAGALVWFEARLGEPELSRTLERYVANFPPQRVFAGELTPQEWLRAATQGVANRRLAMEGLIMLWLANANPAFAPLNELIDEKLLEKSAYTKLVAGLRGYFETRPRFGKNQQNLLDVLRAPALAAPDSLAAQLAFLREHFAGELPELLREILVALDLLKEQELAIWALFNPPSPGKIRQHGGGWMQGDSSAEAIPHFGYKGAEYERFSPDVDWMPSTVMMAKSTYVWLDQLSRASHQEIRRLDQIPEEELQTLARRGFNALWLIGLWERSAASRRIKQLAGNPEAAASAYSLHGYEIAEDLGGEAAYRNLRERCQRYGIRLASDMVPNHMGIDSSWVTEHPDWFISLPYSPYPNYTFEGPDVSSDGRVEIKIEDHYLDRTDAAVVFRRRDRWTGDTRYIYHGNDGTSFPWNDTAQLNYLNPEVREAVIQTILGVARKFPIIRFDAAMTLTKQHFQRLWYPAPGSGAGIPSRTEHGLTKKEFDHAMPAEFWREVVDRVAAEVPGTLLLAEAFWLLEGYFVRTLGMHRVYNSAFMNMLRDEENANYRSVLKNTLEFDPEVLKRYVNFMNNPDERTAVDQFGKGDKYFGICTLLATLPGLPMFGHGQIEGYTERYGMEYRRAYYDEQPDGWLVGRHEREISPLLHRRRLFAEVANFLLYDFYSANGTVSEDVYAYSNRLNGDRGVVVFNNRYASASGWIRLSAAYAEKDSSGHKRMQQKSLAEGLAIEGRWGSFAACRDFISGEEYLIPTTDIAEKGLHFSLGAYQRRVLLDWRILEDSELTPWGGLHREIGAHGVPSLDEAMRDYELRPVLQALEAVFDPKLLAALFTAAPAAPAATGAAEVPAKAEAAVKSAPVKSAKRSENKEIIAPETGAATVPADEAKALATAAEPLTAEAMAHAGETLVALVRGFYESVQRYQRRVANREQRPSTVPTFDLEAAAQAFAGRLHAAGRWPLVETALGASWSDEAAEVLPSAQTKALPQRAALVAWALLDALESAATAETPEELALRVYDRGKLRQAFAAVFERLGWTGEERWYAAARLRFLFAHPAKAAKGRPGWIQDPEVSWLIGSHDFEGERFFNKELYERLVWWSSLPGLMELAATPGIDAAGLAALEASISRRLQAAAEAGYRVEALLESEEGL